MEASESVRDRFCSAEQGDQFVGQSPQAVARDGCP